MVIFFKEKTEAVYRLFPFVEIKINLSLILAASEWAAGRSRP
jgi:hypothetical protein